MKKLCKLLILLSLVLLIGGCNSKKDEDPLKAEIEKLPGVVGVTVKYDPLPPTHNYSVSVYVEPNTDMVETVKAAGGIVYHKGKANAKISMLVESESGDGRATFEDLGITSMDDYKNVWGEQ